MPKKNPAAVALGRLGGKVRSAAKTKAARENAKKKRSRTMKTAFVLVALLLTGCTSGRIGALPRPAPTDAAEVVVIRTTGFVGCAAPLPVTVDGEDAYGLACGEHVILTVATGERIIGVKTWRWFVTDENTLALTVASGRRYYLRLDVSGLSGPTLNRLTDERGRQAMAQTTPAH